MFSFCVILGLLLSGCGAEDNKCAECVDSDGDGLCDVCESDTPTADTPNTPDSPSTPDTPGAPNTPSTPNVSLCQHRDADDDYFCDKCGDSYADLKDVYDKPEPTVCSHRDNNVDGKCDKCKKHIGYSGEAQSVLEWNAILERGYFVCGVRSLENMSEKLPDGSYTGLESEFATEVAKQLGIEVVFKEIDWSKRYDELYSGAIDCIWSGFVINGTDSDDNGIKRRELVDFSYGYSLDSQCLVTEKDLLWQSSALSYLAVRYGAVVEGSKGAEFVDAHKILYNVTSVEAPSDAFGMLSQGEVSYIIVDRALAEQYCAESEGKFAIVDNIAIKTDAFTAAFKKGSDVTERFNAALKSLDDSGRLAEIASKYGFTFEFFTDIPYIYEPLNFYERDFIPQTYNGIPRNYLEKHTLLNVSIPTADKIESDGYVAFDFLTAFYKKNSYRLTYSEALIDITADNFLITSAYGESAEDLMKYSLSTMHAADVTGYVKPDMVREGYSFYGFNDPIYLTYVGDGESSGEIHFGVKLYMPNNPYFNEAIVYYATDGEYIAFSIVSVEKAKEALEYRTVSDYVPKEQEIRTIPEEPEKTVIGTAVSTRTGELELEVSTSTLFPQENGELFISVKSNYDIPVDVKLEVKTTANITDQDGESAKDLLQMYFEMNGETTFSRSLYLSIKGIESKDLYSSGSCRIRFIVYDKDGVEIDNVALTVNYVKYYDVCRFFGGQIQFLN